MPAMHTLSLANDVAIDLGTAITRVLFARRNHLEVRPTILGANDAQSHPLRGGIIVDIGGAAAILEPLLRSARRFGVIKPRALTCIPSDATTDDRDALEAAARAAGASSVTITTEPLAAAIGAGVDVTSEFPRMVVDFGDGVTDAAVFANGELLTSGTLRTGCSDLRHAIATYLDETGFHVGDDEADRVMREVCGDVNCEQGVAVRAGQTSIVVPQVEIIRVVRPVIEQIADFVGQFVESLPDRVGVCVIEDGITATGGGALLPAVRSAVMLQSGIRVVAAEDPLHAVIRGAGKMLGSR
jgi:rod shape-determining protein MreB and related proteins